MLVDGGDGSCTRLRTRSLWSGKNVSSCGASAAVAFAAFAAAAAAVLALLVVFVEEEEGSVDEALEAVIDVVRLKGEGSCVADSKGALLRLLLLLNLKACSYSFVRA